jgi:hypothetical protein
MQSIAEVGNGNFSFIPDAGMIGTVFVHAVANLYTTLGTSARIELESLQSKTSVEWAVPAGLSSKVDKTNRLLVDLGNIQYGQSRDVLVDCSGISKDSKIRAVLT